MSEKSKLAIAPAQLEGFRAQALYLRGKRYRSRRGGLAGLVRLFLGRKRPV